MNSDFHFRPSLLASATTVRVRFARALTVGAVLTITLAGLTGCPSSSSSDDDSESEAIESVKAEPIGLSPEEIDIANSAGLATAEKIGRQVTAWYGKKEGATKFTHAGSAVKVDDTHTVTLTDAEWKAFSDLFKLKHGRDFTVPTPERSDKDSLGKLMPIVYKFHRYDNDSFQILFVGMPARMG